MRPADRQILDRLRVCLNPQTQTALMRATGLAKPTVSRGLTALRQEGLVRKAELSMTDRRKGGGGYRGWEIVPESC